MYKFKIHKGAAEEVVLVLDQLNHFQAGYKR